MTKASPPQELYAVAVGELSVRTINALQFGGIKTINDLITKRPHELLKLRMFGRKSLLEVDRFLLRYNLTLAGAPPVPDLGTRTTYTTSGGLEWLTNFPQGSVGWHSESEFMEAVDSLHQEVGFGRMKQLIQHAWERYLAKKYPPKEGA